jgi:hypothetical protein
MIQVKMWLRIIAIVILLTALLAYAVKRALPDFEFQWGTHLALSIGGLVFALACFFAIHWLVPPIIGINAKGVSRQQGQSCAWRSRVDIRRITIDTTDPAHPRLNIEATAKKPLECGIAAKVSTPSLVSFLHATFPELVVEEKR